MTHSTSKISIELADGKTLSNILDMNAAENATVILFKYSTNSGLKQIALFTEDIKGISTF